MPQSSGTLVTATKPRIMCVEDDDSGRQLLQEWLEILGYEAFCFSDGRQFLSMLSVISPQLLLLDLKLPYVDGFTLLEQLQRSEWKSIPVIVLSAYCLKRERERAFSLGCLHYLVKPTPLESLKTLIQSELEEPSGSSVL